MSVFKFKFFDLKQSDSPMKVGTDAMLIGAFANVKGKSIGLDVGTGTGVLALMCAQRNDSLKMQAVELDELAFMECDVNFKNSSFSERLKAFHSDFLKYNSDTKFDFIISNPPYYQSRLENDDERKSKSRHESSLPKAKFFKKVSELLMSTGDFWIIIPFDDTDGWIDVASNYGLQLNQSIYIIGKEGGEKVRSILQFSQNKTEFVSRNFTVRQSDGSYTGEYIQLTREYHFKSLKKKEA